MLNDSETYSEQIANLTVDFSETPDGLVVFSTSEPFFCYDVASKEEAKVLVEDTIRSYRRFYRFN